MQNVLLEVLGQRAVNRVVRWLGAGSLLMLLAGGAGICPVHAQPGESLPETELYDGQDDLAAQTLDGIATFLRQKTADSRAARQAHWNRDLSSPEAYAASVQVNRQRLRRCIGAVDPREPLTALEYLATTEASACIARTPDYTIQAVRWRVVGPIYGEGLLLEPAAPPRARIVALADADQTPEMLVGLVPGIAPESQFARRLAESGCQVLIPQLIDRDDQFSGNSLVNRFTNQPHREWVYRQAFQMGRHVIGYEVQKVLAGVDWFVHASRGDGSGRAAKIGVAGYGEGGLVALSAAALDERIDAALVSGYFEPRETLWQEPIYRNVWGLLQEFGDAELASLVAPRTLIVEYSQPPQISGPPPPRAGRSGAAPGRITTPDGGCVAAEFARAKDLVGEPLGQALHFIHGDGGTTVPAGSEPALARLLAALDVEPGLRPPAAAPAAPDRDLGIAARQERQVRQMEAHTQQLMERSAFARAEFFWKPARQRARESARQPAQAAWQEAVQPLRQYLHDEVIGRLPPPSLPPRARTRKIRDEARWTGYLVVLDVWPDVISWGYLLLPKDLQPGQRRPVVVCQHGLGSEPESTIDPQNKGYRGYAARLAEQGFVVYAPYNPNAIRGGDRFRVLQRLANPLKCSIFSVILGQHERILQWLATQPFVDSERIGFYGLSYGGKTAMRVPALLDGYALSICSGDFNEWIRKVVTVHAVTNAAAGSQQFSSYMFTGEYEIMEFDLGHTFNYAELAALIAPRPFMVERGHRDLVAADEWAAFEYATVRRLYADLQLPERTEIEFFDDGHVIHGQGTFRFLQRHLGEK